jgi:hypothetical protein
MKNRERNLNLGRRKVSDMNFSKIVTLPKTFTNNYLDESKIVEMSMTPDGRLMLTPVRTKKGE